MKSFSASDIETSNTNYECLLYSTAKDATYVMKDSTITCRSSYFSTTSNPTY